MTTERLVYMANQIATFFRAAPKDQAVASTADHIKKFWDPRMRKQIVEQIKASEAKGLNEIALAAIQTLAEFKPH